MSVLNYELKICDAKHLNGSTVAHVKAKLKDLIKAKPDGEYKKFYKNAEKIPQVIQLWKSVQMELIKQWLAAKEAQRIHLKNNDLERL